MTTEHITVAIDRSAGAVYAYASDPAHLPTWASGLADTPLTPHDGRWTANSPMGEVVIDFAPHNDFGILDHDVTLPSGEVVYNPMRVLADGGTCEVVFTVRQRQGVSDEEFGQDLAAVRRDLETLRDILEASP
ncbi:hypothetical protein F4553_001134 [Allocatelliglobosispora scoriae]|uniref:SRPBCC family protein n=1 Tax=Allocatelliglobosispora scoriae TaxID=643052 RepID=A0A841BJF1_9ACTN|nr:SRPBCC family protein [Allocatelliglobosispora scoriae]MBB5867755.1 hypothetical protein [Allocatelliglobosispora scoriae]